MNFSRGPNLIGSLSDGVFERSLQLEAGVTNLYCKAIAQQRKNFFSVQKRVYLRTDHW